MRLLFALDEAQGYLPPDLARKALSSSNSYVRFLAGRRVRLSDNAELTGMAKSDSDSLVQSSQARFGLAGTYALEFLPRFWALPPASRYVYLAEAEEPFGPKSRDFVKILDFALSHDVPADEIGETAVEYVETLRTVADKRYVYVLPLWEFLPRCPISLAVYLVKRLPDPRRLPQDLVSELLKREEKDFLGLFLDRDERSFRRLRQAILRSKVLDLDAKTKAEISSSYRVKITSEVLRPFAPFSLFIVFFACWLVFVEADDLKLTTSIAAAAAIAILLRTFMPGRSGP